MEKNYAKQLRDIVKSSRPEDQIRNAVNSDAFLKLKFISRTRMTYISFIALLPMLLLLLFTSSYCTSSNDCVVSVFTSNDLGYIVIAASLFLAMLGWVLGGKAAIKKIEQISINQGHIRKE